MEGTAAAGSGSDRARSDRYRFGDFEVDLHCGELRKSGLRVRTQDQPLQVLSILLSRPGEIVTREEFRARLWPADIFVDFDHGLNSAIKRLRHLLEDDPERPHYIETLPRHGYRFIGAVSAIEPPEHHAFHGQESEISAGSRIQPLMLEPGKIHRTAERANSFAETARSHPLWRHLWTVTITLLALTVLLAGIYGSRQRALSRRKVMLAVLPLTDLSGDRLQHALADGMTEELITQLGKADPEKLGVIAHTSVEQYRDAKQPVSVIGRQLGVDYVLEGSARAEGNHVRISVQLIKVSDQTHLWAEEYDRTLDNALGLQADVAANVVRGIRGKLNQQDHPPMGTPPVPTGMDRR